MPYRRRHAIMAMVFILYAVCLLSAEAHQDPCHRLHSCPSDHGTYVCGDKGRCDQCPDNGYCLGCKPRVATSSPTEPRPAPPTHGYTVVVKRVINGDTLELTTGEKVRLIGVDTPETKDRRKPVQYFGKEAAAFTQRAVEGKRVRLEYDQQRHDKYGRTLAYVYLDDGTFVNAEIIKQRYGFAYTRFPFKHPEHFRTLEREAREAKRGLWAAYPHAPLGPEDVNSPTAHNFMRPSLARYYTASYNEAGDAMEKIPMSDRKGASHDDHHV